MPQLEHPDEVWKDVAGFEGYYQVSNYGKVKSLTRQFIGRDNFLFTKKERSIKPSFDSKGYYQVKFFVGKTIKSFKVHRLVGEAFLPDFDKDKQINHINGIKTDNRITNLECVDNMQNMTHRVMVLEKKPRGITKTRSGTWRSYITHEYEYHYLGVFEKQSDAYKAYFEKFKELRGCEPWDLKKYKTH